MIGSPHPWRAGLWDLFRCLELSLESGDWENDRWAYPVEIDIFSTKINVNKISDWEKTYSKLWCFTGIIVFHFLKKSLSSFLVSLALEAAKVGNSTRTQSRNKNRPIWGVSSGQVKTCWFGRAPGLHGFASFTSTFLWDTPVWRTSHAFGWWFRAGICCIIGSIICGNDIPTARWIITYHHYMNQMPAWCRWLWMQIADQLI